MASVTSAGCGLIISSAAAGCGGASSSTLSSVSSSYTSLLAITPATNRSLTPLFLRRSNNDRLSRVLLGYDGLGEAASRVVVRASTRGDDNRYDVGVIKDMELYLNDLSVEYDSVWDTKPACFEVDSSTPAGDVISRAAGATVGAPLVSGKSNYGNSDMDVAEADRGDNNGGGSDNGNGACGGGDGGGEEGNQDTEEFGPILNAEQVQQEVQRSGITLPPDMLEASKSVGIRQLLLSRYIELQGAAWPLGAAIRENALLRNRMLADRTFLFKVFTEVAIDSGCATFAEVQKRGKDFWNEFELYLSDLSVGIVLDIALVGLLAPYVQFGAVSTGSGTKARLSRAIQALPSSIFEAQRPGRVFSLQQRIGTLFFKAGQYGVAGFACGIVGQGLASGVMTLKRKLKKTEEEEVAVPSIVKSAALWAVFMGVSSNTRYQIINGLERVVEGSIISRRVPQIALAFTIGIRFANNIYGGMQFVDWARLAGVQ